MAAIIELDRVSFRYPGAARDTLRNVSLSIEQGDFVAIVGGNGSGKTTLCKTFNGLVPHYWEGDFAGEARVCGLDTYESTVASLSARVGYVYQDFQNQLVRPRVRDEVTFAPMNFGYADFEERGAESLATLRIEELAERFVWQLSGGQAHLTALASVLAMRPEIIVVDEPVAEVDPARAHDIYARLTELNRDHGITVIVIEHHAEFIAQYARSVVLMADGAPVWHLPVDEAVMRTAELEEHGIPAPQVVQASLALGLTEAPRTVAIAAARLRAAGATPREDWRPTEPTLGDGPAIAEVARLSHGYRSVSGELLPVLSEIDLAIRTGDRIALVGGNGAGKSTLLRLLAGLTVAREGAVTLDGVNTREAPAAVLAETAAYLYQRPEQMFLKDSIRADVALFPSGRRRPGTEALVERVLDRVRLAPFSDRDGRTLSGGQQRRATLAIGLAMTPRLLLLDEPTASLDVASRDSVIAMLDDLSDTIAATAIATHDMHLVAEWANRVLVLESGSIVADLSPRDLFSRPALLERAHLVPPQITQIALALGITPLPLTLDEWTAAVTLSAAHLAEGALA